MSRKTVVLGLLGSRLDAGADLRRWENWRPTVAVCQHEELLIDRFELLHEPRVANLARVVAEDISSVSPETRVRAHVITFRDPWEFEEVYGALHEFARSYPFDTEREDYLVHITTGTHVVQICLFLLTESRHLPARLLQTSPPPRRHSERTGSFRVIDLDLSKYDRLATRFELEQKESLTFLKSGIETKNSAFNRLIEQIERVAIRSNRPILLMGPTGAGKSQLARRIYELKKLRGQVEGDFVEVNCAMLRGDQVMSTLFGHLKGAFTGATRDRAGLLRAADGGVLLLDEIGELDGEGQAMLLRALEEKKFLPVGADTESSSDFQLIAGTNRDLLEDVRRGAFREDLLARINVWTFRLPGLMERREDIEPNLAYELEQYAATSGVTVRFNKEARRKFIEFARAPDSTWDGNFRDLNAAITRMATLSTAGRITVKDVEEEIDQLRANWSSRSRSPEEARIAAEQEVLDRYLDTERVSALDLFDRAQLVTVLRVCEASRNLSEAGRRLFGVSRTRKRISNDADRLRKYLARFEIEWRDVVASGP